MEGIEPIIRLILAAGALGTASFGLVESAKYLVGTIGFGQIKKKLSQTVFCTIVESYGDKDEELLKSFYRRDRTAGELPRALRQGVRIGLSAESAPDLAKAVGVVSEEELKAAAQALASGREAQRNVIGRFELAIDARIDGALAAADTVYRNSVRAIASLLSIMLALAAWGMLAWDSTGADKPISLLLALLIGLVAVPVAPVAKDLTTALTAAAKAVRPKRPRK